MRYIDLVHFIDFLISLIDLEKYCLFILTQV